MIRIIEIGTTDISYKMQFIDNDTGKITNESVVKCKSVKVNKNGIFYYVLFDRDFKIIPEAFRYLNIFQKNNTEQTKQLATVALKYLYSYCSVFNIEIKDMGKDDAVSLMSFMHGQSIEGTDFSLSFNSVRSSSSVNDYLSVLRNYIIFLGFKKHPLLAKSGKKRISLSYKEPSYQIKMRSLNRNKVPAYINQVEFVRMVNKCHENHNLRLECIIRLMYQSGLRIGEVLGLTFEDIIEKDGKFKVILRNRITDKTFQKAKFLMTITDRNQYKSSDYKREWYGWNEMAITANLYECLMNYIEDAHSSYKEDHPDLWRKKLSTDIVSNDFNEKDNFYVFVNSCHRPLSGKTVEEDIKKLFLECGVGLNDDGGKVDGLAHRFRHGFAMYQVTVNNIDKLPLSKMMRHRNIESCEKYYTPEITDIIRIKNDISESVYDLLPRFELDE